MQDVCKQVGMGGGKSRVCCVTKVSARMKQNFFLLTPILQVKI